MKELECLREMYIDEIKKITKKGELTPADSEAAKKALEAIEMIDDICERGTDDTYSERSYRRYGYKMPDMRMYHSRSNGAVSRMIRTLEDMTANAPTAETRMAIESAIEKLEAY